MRELRNVVETALAMGRIHLNGQEAPVAGADGRRVAAVPGGARHALAAFERTYLRKLIDAAGGNASAAARTANMDRPYLLSLLRRHGLR